MDIDRSMIRLMGEAADEIAARLGAAHGFGRPPALVEHTWSLRGNALSAETRWMAGDLHRGGLVDWRDAPPPVADDSAVNRAVLKSLEAGVQHGSLVIGRDFAIWEHSVAWRAGENPSCVLLRVAPQGFALLRPLAAPPALAPLLLAIGRTLERGAAALVRPSSRRPLSGHERATLERTLAPAAALANAGGGDILANWIMTPAADHFLWRTPADMPDAAMLIDGGQRDADETRGFGLLALAAL